MPSFTPLWSLGFRPFFLAAGVYAVIAMILWFAVYSFGMQTAFTGLPPSLWHAHEMIYGYALAVIAGFLLTAVSNWTGLPTLRGAPLALLLCLWLGARICVHLPAPGIVWAGLFDMLFAVYLAIGVTIPIVRKRQWRQTGIVSKLLLIGAGNLMFYLGVTGYLDQGIQWGLYTGFYLVIGLILTMSRRLIPFFVERGLTEPVQLRNSGVVDAAALILYLVFFVAAVFVGNDALTTALAAALFALHVWRLAGWYTPGIWHQPLLWSLYLAYLFIILGFLLIAFSPWWQSFRFPALHAFAVGGIGVITLSMMARVTLGHTGRNVLQPPRPVGVLLLLLGLAALVRVAAPLLLPGGYGAWVELAQLLWIAAFAGFVAIYVPMLTRASLSS
jgi:uncharacterized protein involved in response to NO